MVLLVMEIFLEWKMMKLVSSVTFRKKETYLYHIIQIIYVMWPRETNLENELDDSSNSQCADIGSQLQVVADRTDEYRQPEQVNYSKLVI